MLTSEFSNFKRTKRSLYQFPRAVATVHVPSMLQGVLEIQEIRRPHKEKSLHFRRLRRLFQSVSLQKIARDTPANAQRQTAIKVRILRQNFQAK